MSEIIIPAFKDETEFKDFLNNNPIYLYNPDKIGELNNEISKLENGLTLSNEYFSQLTSFTLDSVDLENKFTVIDEAKELTPEQKAKSKGIFLSSSIDNNYELISSWYKDPDFSEITKNDLVLKNLILIYKHTGKDPREFIKEQKQAGLTNNMIAKILNFDPPTLLFKEPIKNISNYNGLLEPFKEILQANLVQYAFNVYTQSIKRNNGIDSIPPEAFNNPDFIEILYSGNPSYLTISPQLGKLSIEDIENIIQLRKNFYENYFKIRQDPRLNKKESGMDEITAVFNDNLESLLENLPHKNFSNNYWEFLLNQLTNFYNNIGGFYINSIQSNPKLAAIFAISDFEKYPSNNINENFANELVNILKNYPQYYQQFFEIVSRYSTNNNFFEAILNNNFMKNKYPNLKEEILNDKMNFISEITGEEWLNINPKIAAVISKNDKPEAIKTLISLGNLINSLDSDIINFIRTNPNKYGPVVKNIMEAKSINDITDETIIFFANLKVTEEAKIFLLRFDSFKSIVEKMHEKKIEIKKINNVLNWTASKFMSEVPQKFSDETIYSNAALENSFLYLLQKSSDSSIKYLSDLFPKSLQAKKIRAEIENEKKTRDSQNEVNKISTQYNKNKIFKRKAMSKLTLLISKNNPKPQNTQNKKIEVKGKSKKSIFPKSHKNKKLIKIQELKDTNKTVQSQQQNKKCKVKEKE